MELNKIGTVSLQTVYHVLLMFGVAKILSRERSVNQEKDAPSVSLNTSVIMIRDYSIGVRVVPCY